MLAVKELFMAIVVIAARDLLIDSGASQGRKPARSIFFKCVSALSLLAHDVAILV